MASIPPPPQIENEQERTRNSGIVDNVTGTVKTMSPERLVRIMRVCNIINAILLLLSGAISLYLVQSCVSENKCNAASMALLSFYTVLFAGLLLVFEIQIPQVSYLFIFFGFVLTL